MKTRKAFIGLLFALIPLVSSCGGGNSDYYDLNYDSLGILTDVPKYEVNDKKFLEDRYVKFHGRYYYDSEIDATWMSYSGSGFEVTFEGTTLEADFFTTNADVDKSRPFLAVAIDGDYDPTHMTTIALTGIGNYSNVTKKVGKYSFHEHVVLAYGLEDTVHTVRVYKKSECLFSRVAVQAASTDGKILAVQPKETSMKMEVFGDSVTCGYAVESLDFYENFTTSTENSCKSYANIAANELNSDVSLISCGGYPMYKSKHNKGCKPDNIPDMFSMSEVEWSTSFDHPWDNSKYVPDVTVIALGANDGSILDELSKGSQEYNDFLSSFKAKYLSFIDTIFEAYPNTLLVISDEIVPFNQAIFSKIDEVYDEVKDTRNVIRAKYDAYNEAKDKTLPGQGHPNWEMQRLAGEELAAQIKEALNK